MSRRSPDDAVRLSGPPGRYVYGVIAAAESRTFRCAAIGSGGRAVWTVHEGEIAAVVSPSSVVIYEPTRENLAAHEAVAAAVECECPMIPLPFGTVMHSEHDVRELLRSGYLAFSRALEKLRDKIEFDLQVLWNPVRMADVLEHDSDQLQHLREELERRTRGSTYYARARLRRALNAELREAETRLVSGITEELRAVSVASRSARPVGDGLILSATFLVDRRDAGAFDEKLREIAARHEDVLSLRCSGPAPPRSFLSVHLELERAE